MIRASTPEGWLLVTHPDHARLAGEFADLWGNASFPRPQPWAHVRAAVYSHDDGWIGRDAAPVLTRAGLPSAFTRELVGSYSAFEEIDLADYLAVRGQALDAIVLRDPYAAVLVSMHTVNLLTEQADLSTIKPEDRPRHTAFISAQRLRQQALAETLRSAREPGLAAGATPEHFARGFRFLQCCDNFSLIACSDFAAPRPLRHAQERTDGPPAEILCTPRGDRTFALSPWPLAVAHAELTLPVRRVAGATFPSVETYRAAFAAAKVETVTIRLVPG